jgi:hypothetical protein
MDTINSNNNINTNNSINIPITLRKMNTNASISDNTDSVSINSSKIDSSQERFKKIRGFNFKNNINTKKYNKPLLNSNSDKKNLNRSQGAIKETESENMTSFNDNTLTEPSHQDESNFKDKIMGNVLNVMNVLHSNQSSSKCINMNVNMNNVNKSSNLEEKIKMRKFNFNNNINIKKFIRQDISYNNNQNNAKEREKQYNIEMEENHADMIDNISKTQI